MTKMESSGEERIFSTGAVRDSAAKKPTLQYISPYALMRLGEWLRFACQDRKPKPYPPRNWEKGMLFSECIGSLERHVQQFKMGLENEDHLAAILFNAMALCHYENEIGAGRMDSKIDDMPRYEQQEQEYPTVSEQYEDGPLEIGEPPYSVITKINAPTFYLAGPMRGYENLNFSAFDEAAKFAREQGLNIISPAEMDREVGINPDTAEQLQKDDPNFVQAIVQRDCEAIIKLNKSRGDGLILLPHWQESTGARAEVALALWLGLKFTDETHLLEYSSKHIRQCLFHQER